MAGTARHTRGLALGAAGLVGFVLLLRACRGDGAAPAAPETVDLDERDIAIVHRDVIRASARISGTLEAATEATLRAEVAGTVRDASAEEGDPVVRGTLLVRIDAPGLGAARRSAQAAVSSAEIAVRNARRDVERLTTLVTAGAAPRRNLDDAHTTLAVAQSQLASARSLLADVQVDQAATTVQAPFAGIVSEKIASDGDVVQVGGELYRIIDPATMALEAQVPADALMGLTPGATVEFTVRGYAWRFRGTVERIHPSADPATRQVPIRVTVPNLGRRLVQGLFADGTVTLGTREGLVVPIAAIREEQGSASAMRLRGGVVQEVAVRLGLEDPVRLLVEVSSGLAAGDTVLRGPAMEIAPGTRVRVERAMRDSAAGVPAAP